MPLPYVKSAKLVWIWSETIIEGLGAKAGLEPLSFLQNEQDFVQVFKALGSVNFWEMPQAYPQLAQIPGLWKIISSPTHPNPSIRRFGFDLDRPWTNHTDQRFWHYYLGSTEKNTSGQSAWEYHVPLRGRLPALITDAATTPRVAVEGFLYPHGTAIVITFTLDNENLSLDEFVQRAMELRSMKFTTGWRTGSTLFTNSPWKETAHLNLNQISSSLLTMLRSMTYGENTEAALRNPDPLSIVTVLKGTIDDPALPLKEGDEIHRCLEALTSWSKSWKVNQPSPLADRRLAVKGNAPSHALYAAHRGCVVWFPGLFSQQNFSGRTLSCYTRNQVFLSLQVDTLVGLLMVTAAMVNVGTALPFQLRECARTAAGILGRLWGGDAMTYRSNAAKAQMLGHLKEINAVRNFFNMTLLG